MDIVITGIAAVLSLVGLAMFFLPFRKQTKNYTVITTGAVLVLVGLVIAIICLLVGIIQPWTIAGWLGVVSFVSAMPIATFAVIGEIAMAMYSRPTSK